MKDVSIVDVSPAKLYCTIVLSDTAIKHLLDVLDNAVVDTSGNEVLSRSLEFVQEHFVKPLSDIEEVVINLET